MDLDQQVSLAVRVRIGHSFPAQADDVSRLRPLRNLELLLPVEQRDIQLGPECGLREADGNRTDQIVPLADEEGVIGDVDLAEEIAPRTAEVPRFSFSAQAELHAV